MLSISKFFNLNNLEEIIIVIKNNDKELLLSRLNELKKNNIKLPLKIMKESELFSESSDIKNTYYLQMYLKLLAATIIKTDKYLTLDADILFINNTDTNDLYDDKIFFNKNKQINGL